MMPFSVHIPALGKHAALSVGGACLMVALSPFLLEQLRDGIGDYFFSEGLRAYTQKDYAKVEPMWLLALRVKTSDSAAEQRQRAFILNQLGTILKVQERYSESEPFYKQALSLRKAAFGDRDPETTTSMNNLADLYCRVGRYPEAQKLYELELQVKKQTYGEKHFYTRIAAMQLANVYRLQGNEKAAAALR